MCGSKRIVIYDTLIKDITAEMGAENIRGIQAIVGHEIGHSIMHHTWALLGVTQLNFVRESLPVLPVLPVLCCSY
mgnify:CR=1 FL=1|jgi:Zn-dependent protease with chaperone function